MSHIPDLAAAMQPHDLELCEILKVDPVDAFVSLFGRSPLVWTALHNKRSICMFGVEPITQGVGRPWMMSTALLLSCAFSFLRANRTYLNEMLAEFPRLCDLVDCRNKISIRWLEWNGFQMGASLEWEGRSYMPFSLEA